MQGLENKFKKEGKQCFHTAACVPGTITQFDSLVRHSIPNANKAKALRPSAPLSKNEWSRGKLKQLSALKLDKFCICVFYFLHSVNKNHQSQIFTVLETLPNILKYKLQHLTVLLEETGYRVNLP